jgi:hypothetical protein
MTNPGQFGRRVYGLSDDSLTQIGNAGEVAFMGQEGLSWPVYGTNGDHLIQVRWTYQS